MRSNGVMVVLGVVLGLSALPGTAAAFSASYDQKTTLGGYVTTSTVSFKDDLFRMEVTDGSQTMVILRNRTGTYTVMPSEGMAMKMAMLRPGQGPIRGAGNYAQYLQERQAELIGTEMLNEHACDIYRYTDPETGDLVTAWVWTEKMFPIQFESEGSEGKMRIELSNLQLGATIPDADFQLPDGVQVMDMNSLMNMQ